MIYYVSNTKGPTLNIGEVLYTRISVEQSLTLLNSITNIGLDSETLKLDVYTGKLLLLQLGNSDFQIVIDCTSIDLQLYKELLENPSKLFIIHNAKFDLKWLYKLNIIIPNLFDTFLAEKILYLGVPPGIVSLSLQGCCKRYLNVILDKSVRSNIHRGITDEVIVYAANDVVHLEHIMKLQLKELKYRAQINAINIENEFVKVLTYIEYCGIKLDQVKWRKKMTNDSLKMRELEVKLNTWLIEYAKSKNPEHPDIESTLHIIDVDMYRGSNIIEDDRRNLGKSARRVQSNDIISNGTIIGEAWETRKHSPYVTIELQTNLFTQISNEPIPILNWGSPQQLIYLFKELGLSLLVKDKKTGLLKDSVDSSVLKSQINKHPIISTYLEYSGVRTVVESFGKNFLTAINPITQRIHPTFNQLQDTGRLSCGSSRNLSANKDTEDGDIIVAFSDSTSSVNIQQIPNNEETRSAFVAEYGNYLIDSDYSDQEGKIFAELCQDKKWIEFYNSEYARDGHGFVAKMCFPKELEGIDELDVGKVRKDLRQNAKNARFSFNYNGSAETFAASCNLQLDFAKTVYDNYFKNFSGIASYFKSQKTDMWNRGYILISKYTGLRSYIYNWRLLKDVDTRVKTMKSDFWDHYKKAKVEVGNTLPIIPSSIILELCTKFASGLDINLLAGEYQYSVKRGSKVNIKYINISSNVAILAIYKYLCKRKSSAENQACNYTSQGTAASMSKIAGIYFFREIQKRELLFTVKIVNIIHDEYLVECPIGIVDEISKLLKDCMEKAAALFCKDIVIKADPEYADHWIH